MIWILAQGMVTDAIWGVGGVGVTVLALLIKRGFELRVGNRHSHEDKPDGAYNAELCHHLHAEIDRRQEATDEAVGKLSDKMSTNFASVHQKIDRIAEHLMPAKRPGKG